MKKTLLLLAATAATVLGAQAQDALRQTNFGSNWSIGLDGGVVTPMSHSAFFGSMRPVVGLHLQKQISPVFGLGVEGQFGINTSSWKGRVHSSTAFDNSYVGAYGTVNLFNLFGGYQCETRPFDIDVVAGAGWGHDFINESNGSDWNYFATKVGLNFNFNVSQHVTLAVKPAITWDMSDADIDQTSAGYNRNNAVFSVQAGVTYKFGDGFECVQPYNQAEVDALNARINELRAQAESSQAEADANAAKIAELQAALTAAQNRPAQVIKETSTNLESVRFVFFKIGSSVITADQMPNVVMIADYMKNHPNAKVEIKGYASQDGNLDFNIKLAQRRAESVKEALIKKYGISADRIKAAGEGIGHMFKEESWNRVSICTLDD